LFDLFDVVPNGDLWHTSILGGLAMCRIILIADDSAVFRDLEAKVLETHGYHVIHASNGAETLRKAVEEKPDLILLDIQMPVMDGVQTLALLKKQPETKDIPVFVVSTIGRVKDREILLKGGADEFISKPINIREMLLRIQEHLG